MVDFTHVVCTVVIMLSANNRDVAQLHGTVVKESGDSLYVDFSRELHKRTRDKDLQPDVVWIKENDCLYEPKK